MKFASRYFVAAALAAAPIAASAQTTPPTAAQDEQAREGHRGGLRDRRGPGGPGMGSPVQRLISQRERLELTDAQVQRLEGIQRDLQARNAPLHQQLQAIFPERAQRGPRPDGAAPQGERRARPDSAQRRADRAGRRGDRPQLTEAQRQQMQQRRAQAEPVMAQLRQNTEAALTQARSVLTAEQQTQVRQWSERRGDRREGRREERGERRSGERGDRGRGDRRS
jgi:Spy/CpxP family protein refolding chaperone